MWESLRFGRDISVRRIIHVYPMGRPFCFRGSTNINVLLTLIILVKDEKIDHESFDFVLLQAKLENYIGCTQVFYISNECSTIGGLFILFRAACDL